VSTDPPDGPAAAAASSSPDGSDLAEPVLRVCPDAKVLAEAAAFAGLLAQPLMDRAVLAHLQTSSQRGQSGPAGAEGQRRGMSAGRRLTAATRCGGNGEGTGI